MVHARTLIKYAISNVTSFCGAYADRHDPGILMLRCASVVLGITALYQKFAELPSADLQPSLLFSCSQAASL